MRHHKIYKELKNHSGNPCISFISPIENRAFVDRDEVRLDLMKDVKKMSTLLECNYDKKTVDKLTDKISQIINAIDYTHLPKSLGIYISPTFEKQVFFPFKVSKKIVIDDFFELSAMEELLSKDFRYNVLMITGSSSRFFIGEDIYINEVFDAYFPFFHNKGKKSKSKGEKDNEHFEELDQIVGEYKDGNPMVLIASKENIVKYKSISKYEEDLIGEIMGGYENTSLYQVGRLVWPLIESIYLQQKLIVSKTKSPVNQVLQYGPNKL